MCDIRSGGVWYGSVFVVAQTRCTATAGLTFRRGYAAPV